VTEGRGPSIEEVIARISHPDAAVAAEVQRALDRKTKPRGSLGRLEALAVQVASVRGLLRPAMPVKALVVMGADHGVVAEGVSAYPSEVTGQMLLNFAAGGAAVNVLARQVGAEVLVVDMGVKAPLPEDAPGAGSIRRERVGPGTASFADGPAMSRSQAVQAIGTGIRIASELAGRGVTLIGIGEMGIGNSTAASAMCAALLGLPPAEVVGRGTGIDDEGLRRKTQVIERALAVNRPERADPFDVLTKVGGFEIAGLCGVVLGAAAARVPVVCDGFIASTAALAAARRAPNVIGFLIGGHRSAEPGHSRVLEALRLRPLLDLEMRLGEGTGAALAMSLVDAAVRVLAEMATFDSAGVSDSGR
jgi:nicotinate-nucleotide--dimethylbenzimidazole phosphoribosyltransferase